ncbi:MAG: hypothetical protein ACRD1E_00330 [Terriglobales bacterium]
MVALVTALPRNEWLEVPMFDLAHAKRAAKAVRSLLLARGMRPSIRTFADCLYVRWRRRG